MTKDETLKLALEAFKTLMIERGSIYDKAITAIKEALAQPEPGYTTTRNAWTGKATHKCNVCGRDDFRSEHAARFHTCEASSQPEQEQLMRDQIDYGMSVTQGGKRIDPMSIYKEPEQEPVAAESKFDSEKTWSRCSIEHHNWVQSEPEKWPQYQTRLLYTTPPQRKPLTDEEIKAMYIEKNWYEMAHAFTWGAAEVVARAIEFAHGIEGEA